MRLRAAGLKNAVFQLESGGAVVAATHNHFSAEAAVSRGFASRKGRGSRPSLLLYIDSGGGLPDFSNGSACSRALRRDRE
jgi:hypothetical protein